VLALWLLLQPIIMSAERTRLDGFGMASEALTVPVMVVTVLRVHVFPASFVSGELAEVAA
jgi:hypothetical protein